jgi:phosphate transport system substrate-binding protein
MDTHKESASEAARKPSWPVWQYLLHGTAFAAFLPLMYIVSIWMMLGGVGIVFALFFDGGVGAEAMVVAALLSAGVLGIGLLFLASLWRRRFFRRVKERNLPSSFAICLLPFFLPVWYVLAVGVALFSLAPEQKVFYGALLPYSVALFSFVFFGGTLTVFLGAVIITCLTALTGGLALTRNAREATGRAYGASLLFVVTAVMAVVCSAAHGQYRTQVLARDRATPSVRDETTVSRHPRPWRDETDLSAYVPFSPTNRLAVVEAPALSITNDPPRLHGALALYPVYAAAAQALYQHEPWRDYAELVRAGTSPQAFQSLLDDDCDMVFMVMPSEKQFAAARERGRPLEVTRIGREAFVFFVSRVNPVEGLTSEQLRAVYGKRLTNWRKIGGENERILPFQRPVGSGSQTAMERFLGNAPLATPVREEYQMLMGGIVNRVAAYRNYGNAIGFSFRYYVEGLFKHDGVKLLRIDGVAPTTENIRDGTYPLVSELVIVTAGSANPHLKALTAWFLSPQGQALIANVGYVPLQGEL